MPPRATRSLLPRPPSTGPAPAHLPSTRPASPQSHTMRPISPHPSSPCPPSPAQIAPHLRTTRPPSPLPSPPHPPSPHPSSSKPAADAYYSTYRGSVHTPKGKFDHFIRIIDTIHKTNGFWRFLSVEDERRAYACGFTTPEMLLLAVDRGDGPFDDIILRWLPGDIDRGNKPSNGTAIAHLKAICKEREILGKPLSFRGLVPTYPTTTESRGSALFQFRLLKYGIQKGHPQVASLVQTQMEKQRTRSQTQAMSSTAERNENRQTPPRRVSFSTPINSRTSPGKDTNEELSMPLDPALFESPTPCRKSSRDTQLAKQRREGTYPGKRSAISRRSGNNSLHSSPNNDPESPGVSIDMQNESTDSLSVNDMIPCWDCDRVEGHSWDCNIGNIKPLENLTTADYEQLAEAVKRFDPQPWTTHIGPPKESESLDLAAQTKAMAQTIRILDSYKDNPELHALPDGMMIFMWALTTNPDVEVVQDPAF